MTAEVARNSPKRRTKVAGRQKGTPNKVTADVRAAIAQLLESNVENFTLWLAAVAAGEKEGEPELDAEGNQMLDPTTGQPVLEYNWLRRPDPATALKLALDMAEFHIPKLARTEHAIDPEKNKLEVLIRGL